MLQSEKDDKILNSEDGQTFIEFILLLVMLIAISYGLLAGVNRNVSERWRQLISTIAEPTGTDLKFIGE